MRRLRRWLHYHGHHRFCRVVTKRKIVGYGRSWLVKEDGTHIEMTVFGGDPRYEVRTYHA